MSLFNAVRARSFAMLSVAGLLAGCFGGEPSNAEMLEAIRKNPTIASSFVVLAGAQIRWMSDNANAQLEAAMRNAAVEKSGCAAAQGSPGYVCDFKFGLKDSSGQVRYTPSSAKGRFFKSGDGWSFSPA